MPAPCPFGSAPVASYLHDELLIVDRKRGSQPIDIRYDLCTVSSTVGAIRRPGTPSDLTALVPQLKH
jgi:hypothetical protein